MYRTGAAAAAWDAAASSSVDLPTPGSPASRTTAPGTRPPPSTRSSSSSPVGRAPAALASTSAMGTAGLAGARVAGGPPGPTPPRLPPARAALLRPAPPCPAPARSAPRPAPPRPSSPSSPAPRPARAALPKPAARVTASCSTVPQAWHSPQRPDHFVVRHPHSAHWNAGPPRTSPWPGRYPPAPTGRAADTPGRRHSCAPCGEQLRASRRISWPRRIDRRRRSRDTVRAECGRSPGEPSGHSAATPGGAIDARRSTRTGRRTRSTSRRASVTTGSRSWSPRTRSARTWTSCAGSPTITASRSSRCTRPAC